MSSNKVAKLYTGAEMPLFGLGTYESKSDEINIAIKTAADAGYRHIDCAYIYHNEKDIGKALKSLSIPRSELFITSKLWNTFHRPELVQEGIKTTLSDLQLEYLDLYLVHWPFAACPEEGTPFPKNSDETPKADKKVDFKDTWRAMESLVEQGKVKHIGLSNFTEKRIREVLSYAKIRPAVLQVELHPYLSQNELVNFCKKENIHVTAYSPLGASHEPKVLEHPKLVELAKKYNTDTAHVSLAWILQRGITAIPKSTNEKRIRDNINLIEIEAADVEAITNLSEQHRFINQYSAFD